MGKALVPVGPTLFVHLGHPKPLVGYGLGYLYILQICQDILDACNENKNLKNYIFYNQPSHLTDAKALRPRSRLNPPAAFSS